MNNLITESYTSQHIHSYDGSCFCFFNLNDLITVIYKHCTGIQVLVALNCHWRIVFIFSKTSNVTYLSLEPGYS